MRRNFNRSQTLSEIAGAAQPGSFTAREEYDALLLEIRGARIVLFGEGPHGTRGFYRERARIVRRPTEEKHFRTVAIEGDWPGAFRVNRCVTWHMRRSQRK